MKLLESSTTFSRHFRSGQVRIVLLAMLCAALGAGVVLLAMRTRTAAPESEPLPEGNLSSGTLDVLRNLASPVEIRFYSLLDPNTVGDETRQFAARANNLLGRYELEGGGKVAVVRHVTLSDSEAAALAAADAIQPFNLHAGDACFLGIAVVQQDRRETLPRLSPEWEAALEADLTRAISRVANAAPSAAGAAPQPDPQADAATMEQVRRVVPDFETMPTEEAATRIRQKAFEEFKAAAQQMEDQLRGAQQRVLTARSSGSETEQQAAVQALRNLQRTHAETLKEIAARSQEQVEALERFKAAPTAP